MGQGQHDALAVDQTAEPVEILQHVLGIDHQPLDQVGALGREEYAERATARDAHNGRLLDPKLGQQRFGIAEAERRAQRHDQRIVVGTDEAPGEKQHRDREERAGNSQCAQPFDHRAVPSSGHTSVSTSPAGTDSCHALPPQEVCARLRDRRWELIRRYNSALQSERRVINTERRRLDARLANDCGS